MAEKHRYERNIGPRLDDLESKVDLLSERLSRIEAQIGGVSKTVEAEPTKPVTTVEKHVAQTPQREPAPQITQRARPQATMPTERKVPRPELRTTQQLLTARPSKKRERDMMPQFTSFGELEERVTGRLLAWIGGLALIIGAIFFLSLAFSRGWIGPTGRVTIGLVAGAVLVFGGGLAFEKRDRLFGHVLTPVGLGVLSLSFFAGTVHYDLFAVEIGLAGALISAVAAAVIAIRANSQFIAAYGLVTALSAPIVLDAAPSATTIAFLSAALIGTTIVALYRTWNWLPSIAFLLAAPQVSDFVHGDVALWAGLAALAAFWLLNAVAAGGEEFRVPRQRLSVTSTTLLVANAAFIVGWGFYLLRGDVEWGRAPFLVALAAAYLVLGGYFLLRRGDHHPFGMLAFGTGIAAASMALPVQFGGPPVPIGWAAEAAALAWVYTNRKHGYSGLMSLALGIVAIGHLILFEYPLDTIEQSSGSTWPFLNENGTTLTFILAALAVSIYFVRRWEIGIPAAAVGSLLVLYALPFETSGWLLVGAWSVLFVMLYGFDRRIVQSRVSVPRPTDNIMSFIGVRSLALVGLSAIGMALGHLFTFEYPLNTVDQASNYNWPFLNGHGAALGFILAALAVSIYFGRRWSLGIPVTAIGAGLVMYALPFETSGWLLVGAWSVLFATLYGVDQRIVQARVDIPDPTDSLLAFGVVRAIALAGLSAAGLAIAHLVAFDVSLKRLDSIQYLGTPFWDRATAAVAMVIVAFVAAGFLATNPQSRRRTTTTAFALAAWLVPFEVDTAANVVIWSVLASISLGLVRLDPQGIKRYTRFSIVMLALNVLWVLTDTAQPMRLVVRASSSVDHPLFWSGATAAIGSIVLLLILFTRVYEDRRLTTAFWLLAGVSFVYLVSIGVVDDFQRRVGGATALEELQKQAQVALSILWAALGGVALVIGLWRDRGELRLAGLALLAVVTAKVFVYDLASLDAAYRVLSFIGLGVLLLISAYLYQHIGPHGHRPSAA